MILAKSHRPGTSNQGLFVSGIFETIAGGSSSSFDKTDGFIIVGLYFFVKDGVNIWYGSWGRGSCWGRLVNL
jgi:hypothetical protein